MPAHCLPLCTHMCSQLQAALCCVLGEHLISVMPKNLPTGATGLVGGEIVKQLLASGKHEVVGVVR